MKWVCIVCGKKLAEEHKPEACPVCGVSAENFVEAAAYEKPSDKLSESALADFDQALDLERTATRLYSEAAERARDEGDDLTEAFFQALAKNERGHQVAIKFQTGVRS